MQRFRRYERELFYFKNITISKVAFEQRAAQLVEAIKMNKSAYKNNIVIVANVERMKHDYLQPPIYMKQYKDFRKLDQLYHSLFELVYSLKKTELLRSASILIPHTTQFQLPEVLQEVAALRPLKLGDHTLCLLSVQRPVCFILWGVSPIRRIHFTSCC